MNRKENVENLKKEASSLGLPAIETVVEFKNGRQIMLTLETENIVNKLIAGQFYDFSDEESKVEFIHDFIIQYGNTIRMLAQNEERIFEEDIIKIPDGNTIVSIRTEEVLFYQFNNKYVAYNELWEVASDRLLEHLVSFDI